jgi:Fe-S-cluster containining protein
MDAYDFCQQLAATTAADYDCCRCGACCLPGLATAGYVLLEAEEIGRLQARQLPLVTAADGRVRLGTRPQEGRGGPCACVAFEGAAGFSCRCLIYEDRPRRCREFEMGSAACRLARLRAGLPL